MSEKFLSSQSSKIMLQKILDCTQYTEKFGIIIKEQDVKMLLKDRKSILMEQERIEFGESILPKLIYTFCDSPFIYQDNFLETIEILQEIFYIYKNESLDELSDDELLTYMKEHFNSDCQGSLEYLEETCLEEFCRKIRGGNLVNDEQEDE